MNKKVIFISILILCLVSMTGCGKGKIKEAFDISKVAYDNVNDAYALTEVFASDIYEAWRLGIYEKEKVDLEFLARKLKLRESELEAGVVYALAIESGLDPENLSNEDKTTLEDYVDLYFYGRESKFSACVNAVVGAYKANGKLSKAKKAMDDSKTNMKKLSEEYSDYEHYPKLKEFFTTEKAFLEFCENPTGSFEQVTTTINDYKNDVRECKSDLDFIFE